MFLLKAEEQYSLGNLDIAETLYDDAVYSAKKHRFVNEEALANELAGLFFAQTGREYEANVCYSHAIEKYREWEAYGKTKHCQFVMDALGPASGGESVSISCDLTTPADEGEERKRSR